jgi:hypothetical protein
VATQEARVPRVEGNGRKQQQQQNNKAGIKCFNCGKYGHKAAECRNRKNDEGNFIGYLEEYVEYKDEIDDNQEEEVDQMLEIEEEVGYLEEFMENETEIGEDLNKDQEVIDLTSDTEEEEIIDLTQEESSVETVNNDQDPKVQGSIATWEETEEEKCTPKSVYDSEEFIGFFDDLEETILVC